jgi:hypothetical protein
MQILPSRTSHAYSRPDTPYQKPGSKLLFEKGGWAVTDFGLELLSDSPELNDIYNIPAYALLHDLVATDGSNRSASAGGPLYWPMSRGLTSLLLMPSKTATMLLWQFICRAFLPFMSCVVPAPMFFLIGRFATRAP